MFRPVLFAPDIAVYALAVTEEVGDLRIYHAGFIHPGFGLNTPGGSPLVFEIRGHDVDMVLFHGDVVAELRYYPMSEPTELKDSTYQKQELTLSKIFGRFDFAQGSI